MVWPEFIRSAPRRDPTTFIVTFAAWAALNGLSLAMPGEVFPVNPLYAHVRTLGISEHAWAVGMLFDALLLTIAACRSGVGFIASVLFFSALFWAFWGYQVTLGAEIHHFFSAAGAFNIFLAGKAMFAVVQSSRSRSVT